MTRFNFIIAGGVLLLFINGCVELTTTTHVNSDGSCERIIEFEGDSTAAYDYAYPLPSDTTWILEKKLEGDNQNNYTYTLRKKFRRISDLNRELAGAPDSTFTIEIKLKKRFRWFYTFLDYRETYKAFFPYKRIPVTDYLTEEEIELHQLGKSDDEIDAKLNKWFEKCTFAEIYAALTESARIAQHPALSEMLQAQEDTLYGAFRAEGPDINTKEELVHSVMKICAMVLGTSDVWALEDGFGVAIDDAWKKWKFFEDISDDDYINIVTMPGLIVDTNTDKIDGNEVSWEIESNNFGFMDFEMRVESRIVNRWAIYVSGAALLLLVALLFATVVRRRKTNLPR